MPSPKVRRAALALLAFAAALVVVGPLAGLVVWWLAGPHGGVLPAAASPVVLALGWLAVLGLPAWAARRTWRRLSPPTPGRGMIAVSIPADPVRRDP